MHPFFFASRGRRDGCGRSGDLRCLRHPLEASPGVAGRFVRLLQRGDASVSSPRPLRLPSPRERSPASTPHSSSSGARWSGQDSLPPSIAVDSPPQGRGGSVEVVAPAPEGRTPPGTATPFSTPGEVCVAITGGAGQIAYALIPLIIHGKAFGPGKRVRLRLLDVPACSAALEGVAMEIRDCCSDLVRLAVRSFRCLGGVRARVSPSPPPMPPFLPRRVV